ncbi:hypothetical protein [Kangiella sp. HZ709]|uniref:hypothetical protein n=1 Tax=Kangiella sp. HZ709 TaxID=2666328 RepID=UPI0012AF2B83|nr:hypothetical protein [Kangiella sp. HZ709]MRX28440.1 hypothetical protein [Kangiella sp. HZ709]
MSWNTAYLDALGIARWELRDEQPRHEQADAKIEQPEAKEQMAFKSAVQDETAINEAASKKSRNATLVESSETGVTGQHQNVGIKALVNHPNAKFAVLVSAEASKKELQMAWKQLKFAWKQWQNQEIPASLFQLDPNSDYQLSQIETQQLILLDTTDTSDQEQKMQAPQLSHLAKEKKLWWNLLQEVQQRSQLL